LLSERCLALLRGQRLSTRQTQEARHARPSLKYVIYLVFFETTLLLPGRGNQLLARKTSLQ
jgi:hypothetical protein